MKTPKEWKDNLENNVITEEMLEAALFSVNKRAKNCRDKKRLYKGYYRSEKYFTNYQEKEQEYYEIKDKLLSYIEPICIHKEFLGYEKTRIYDTERHFTDKLIPAVTSGRVVWSNSFFNRDDNIPYYDYYWDDDASRCYFFDEADVSKPIYNYYLFYKVGLHTFHRPIDEKQIQEYAQIPIHIIDRIITKGQDISDLCSTQFVQKILQALNNNATIIGNCVNQFYLELLRDEDYDNYESNTIIENQLIDSFLENNLESALAFWGDYIVEEIRDKISSCSNYEKLIKEKPDAVIATEQEYKKRLEDSCRTRASEFTKQISEIEKRWRKNGIIPKEKKLNKIEKKITNSPTYNGNKNKVVTDKDFLFSLFECFDTDSGYLPMELSLTELIEIYIDYSKDSLLPEEINMVTRKLYEANKQALQEKYFTSVKTRLSNLKDQIHKEKQYAKISKRTENQGNYSD